MTDLLLVATIAGLVALAVQVWRWGRRTARANRPVAIAWRPGPDGEARAYRWRYPSGLVIERKVDEK